MKNSTGGYTLPAGPFVPERPIPLFENVPHWKNVNPRVGLAYDVFGAGRTAFKVSLGRYTPQVRSTNAAAPAVSVSPSTTRSWNDTNGNYVPDCALLNPQPNGECGQWNNLAFGTNLVPNRNAQDAIEGLNLQSYNWQASATVQHELRPGMALNVGYFRTLVRRVPGDPQPGGEPGQRLRRVLHHGAGGLPPAQQRRTALRSLRHQAGKVRPGRQPRDPVVELRHAQPGLQRRRRHHDRAIRARRAGVPAASAWAGWSTTTASC